MIRNSADKPKVIVSWSSGKDSALVLHLLLQDSDYKVVGLLTTVTNGYQRVSMHGVREELLELQATNLDLPLYKIRIPKNCSDVIYRNKMKGAIAKLEMQGVSHIAVGDIFLEDIRKYREQQLKETTITPLFPLWGKDTEQLANEFIQLGFKAVISCIDTEKISGDFAGNEFNDDFINRLQAGVHLCGENGEFHTFVYDGPIFSEPILTKKGVMVERSGFLLNDLLISN